MAFKLKERTHKMSLGNLAKTILKNPMRYLHIDHDSKTPLDPKEIHRGLNITSCTEESYVRAIYQIRAIASRRGAYPGKIDIWKSIEVYASEVASSFKNNNQLDNHLKGLYGCSLPKNLREMVRCLIHKSTVVVNNESDNPSKEIRDFVSISFEGLDFTLSKGSSITVGEVKTKTLDFKGLDSVHISKIEGGSIHGLTLNA